LRKKHKLDQHCGCAGVPGKRLPGNRGIFNKLVGSYKSNAKKKNFRFGLTDEQCKQLFENNCFYCGVEPKQIFKHKKCHGQLIYNGIDRLDNETGYFYENVVSCCSICNYMKSNHSLNDFISWIDKVYNNRIVSNYSCNLCGTTLKQQYFEADDRILSCPNCRLGNDSKFELRFESNGDWQQGRCITTINNKNYMLWVRGDELDHPVSPGEEDHMQAAKAHFAEFARVEGVSCIQASDHDMRISPESLAMLRAGIASGKSEPSVYLGSFAQYLDDEDDE
jgi:hypothetical protein